MERTLAWPDSSKVDPARRAAEMVDDAVTSIRNRGHTREHALRVAARELGIRFRRARALLYGDPVTVFDEELASIRAAYLRHLDIEAAHLAARLNAVRERCRSISEEEP